MGGSRSQSKESQPMIQLPRYADANLPSQATSYTLSQQAVRTYSHTAKISKQSPSTIRSNQHQRSSSLSSSISASSPKSIGTTSSNYTASPIALQKAIVTQSQIRSFQAQYPVYHDTSSTDSKYCDSFYQPSAAHSRCGSATGSWNPSVVSDGSYLVPSPSMSSSTLSLGSPSMATSRLMPSFPIESPQPYNGDWPTLPNPTDPSPDSTACVQINGRVHETPLHSTSLMYEKPRSYSRQLDAEAPQRPRTNAQGRRKIRLPQSGQMRADRLISSSQFSVSDADGHEHQAASSSMAETPTKIKLRSIAPARPGSRREHKYDHDYSDNFVHASEGGNGVLVNLSQLNGRVLRPWN